MLWSSFGAAALMSGALVACSSQEAVMVPVPLDECPDADYSTCDTRDAACQKRLVELAACIYGVNAPLEVPAVRVLTEQELLDDLGSEPSDTDAATLPHLERALVELK